MIPRASLYKLAQRPIARRRIAADMPLFAEVE
jgi:hypothetical protein